MGSLSDPANFPALNAYLSTQNNDGRGNLAAGPQDQSKSGQDGAGAAAQVPPRSDSPLPGARTASQPQSASKKAENVEKEQQSEATHATGKTKGSGKSRTSRGSVRSARRQRLRESFIPEQAVESYKRFDKPLDAVEKDFEFDSDEESVYSQYKFEQKRMPTPLVDKFYVNRDPRTNKTAVKEMLKRFREKTQTYEFMIKFNVTVEKTDESTISVNFDKTPGDIID